MSHFIISGSSGFSKPKIQELGGKALNLIKLLKADFPVPAFLVVPCSVINEILEPIYKEIKLLLDRLGKATDEEILTLSAKIQKTILGLSVPSVLMDELQNECHSIFGEHFQVAVRSSAVSEDGTKASFAGQFETILFVNDKNLISNLLRCIASAYGAGVIKYYRFHNKTARNFNIAVIVQQMVNAERSGIGFSVNVHGNLADCIIETGYGLGQGIVSNLAETDTYIVDRQNRDIEKKITQKKSAVRYSLSNGIETYLVDRELQGKESMTQKEILQVTDVLIKAENLLGVPADIEFSFDSEGRLFVLQMRPVTMLETEDIKILDNTNIVESYPGITLPLSYSFALEAYSKVFRNSSKAFRVPDSLIHKLEPVFKNLLAHHQGRVYYRLDNWYRMMSHIHSSKKSIHAWEKAVGLSSGESRKVIHSLQGKIKTSYSLVMFLLNYRRGNRYFFHEFGIRYKSFRNYSDKLHSAEQIWKHFESCADKLFEPWHLTLVNDFLAFKFFGWIQQLIKKCHISENEDFANDILSDVQGVESVEAVASMLRLKEHILADLQLKELFNGNSEDILNSLNSGKFEPFYRDFKDYLDKFGDRTLSDLKLETPSLRQNPGALIDLLRNQVNSPLTVEEFLSKKEKIALEAILKVQSRLKWWNPNYWIFVFYYRMAAYGLKNRENMRLCRSRAYGVVKEIVLEIGKMMVAKKLLSYPEEIFYLGMDEIRNFCMNGLELNGDYKIAERKAQFERYKSIIPPDRIMYTGEQVPDFGAAREKEFMEGDQIGISVSKGKVTAEAIILTEPALDSDVKGKILITRMTDPGWVFLMIQAAGIISEKGSLLSHTAIVGRELGIPVVVGVRNATSLFLDGDIIMLDGDLGIVSKVES